MKSPRTAAFTTPAVLWVRGMFSLITLWNGSIYFVDNASNTLHRRH
jgi:hypothetical protein